MRKKSNAQMKEQCDTRFEIKLKRELDEALEDDNEVNIFWAISNLRWIHHLGNNADMLLKAWKSIDFVTPAAVM
ncbi:hypothetical protein DRJ16_05935 [Candidatus Woesearchaeota archaeon]|nr:MAG: hypothetical protein DRJ16_05935 [Candidatus Woesearchaeota archaeon]